jgi:hypothetical protein
MVKIKGKYGAQAAKEEIEGGGDFVVPPNGFYHLKIVEAEPGYGKDTEGNEDKKRPYIKFAFEIVAEGVDGGTDRQANYGRVWDYMSLTEKAARAQARYHRALSPDDFQEDGAEFEMDTDDALERVVVGRLKSKKEKYNGEMVDRTNIVAMMAVGQSFGDDDGGADDGDAFASADEDDDQGFGLDPEDEEMAEGDDADSDEAIYGEEDPEEESADSDSDNGGILSEDQLNEMGMRDLGALAKEFDLDPKDSVVKYKSGTKAGSVNQTASKKTIVGAILEAQGADADQEDDDDNPF